MLVEQGIINPKVLKACLHSWSILYLKARTDHMPGVDDSSGPLSKADKDEAPSYTIPSTIESASYSKSGSTGPNPFSHLVEKLSVWVSIVTAVLSLVISIYTLVITTYEPELLLIMPNQVRIGQGGGQWSSVVYPTNDY